MAVDLTSFDQQTSGTRVYRGRRCGGSLRRDPRQSEQVAKQVASDLDLAVAAAAAPSGAIRAKASKLRSRLRAINRASQPAAIHSRRG
jgi:hypothetical protein